MHIMPLYVMFTWSRHWWKWNLKLSSKLVSILLKIKQYKTEERTSEVLKPTNEVLDLIYSLNTIDWAELVSH